mgnify:CR=1 FL=1|uniref:Uncharacterized protein n=1 Tax=viral metagenome TaxID=1070528 RepID=A0A6C0BZ89_9ZZZZ
MQPVEDTENVNTGSRVIGTRSLHLLGMLQMLFEDGKEADWQ